MGMEGTSNDWYGPVGPNHLFGPASLLRHWKIVSMCGASALMLGVLFAAFKPITYTASTQLLVYNRDLHPGPEPVITPGRADTTSVENTIEIFKSRSVLTKVIGILKLNQDVEFTSVTLLQIVRNWALGGLNAISDENRMAFERALEHFRGKVAVQRVGTSSTIVVKSTSSDPDKAAVIANEITRSALQVLASADSTSPRASLVRERLQALGPSAYVISSADPPDQPDGPRRMTVVLAAIVAGLGIGAVLALFLDFKDRTIRTAAQIENVLGLECLGVIPRLPRGGRNRSKPQTTKDELAEPRGEFHPWIEESHAVLCQALNRARVVIHSVLALRTVGVTSTIHGEGATTVATTLAQLMARSGKRVLIVDGVRGNPSLSRATASTALSPSTTVPAQAGSLGAGVVSDAHTGVDILPIGEQAISDKDSAWWNRMDEVLREAATWYDLVLVDLPPLASGPDAAIAAQKLDGLLLVLKWSGTETETIQRALKLAGRARFKFAGALLNMADRHLIGRYGDKLARAEAALNRRRARHASRSTESGELVRT
jgi:succinoglycan biosynthesis transport protein ExoP